MHVALTVRSHVEAIPAGCEQARLVEVREDLTVALRQLSDGDARYVARIREHDQSEWGVWHVVIKSLDGRFWSLVRKSADVAALLEPAVSGKRRLAVCLRKDIRFATPQQEAEHRKRVGEAVRRADDFAVWRGRMLRAVNEPVWFVEVNPFFLAPSFRRPWPDSQQRVFNLNEFSRAERYVREIARAGNHRWETDGRAIIHDPEAFTVCTDAEHRLYVAKTMEHHCNELLENLGDIEKYEADSDPVLAAQATRLRSAIEAALGEMLRTPGLPATVRERSMAV
jgi:hypothetical protein